MAMRKEAFEAKRGKLPKEEKNNTNLRFIDVIFFLFSINLLID